MKTTSLRKHKKMMQTTSFILKDNPVLAMGFGISFAVVSSLTLKNGIMMSAMLSVATIPTVLISALIGDKLKKVYKIPILVMIAIIIVHLSMSILDSTKVISEVLGIYVSLAATNSILLYLLETEEGKTPSMAVQDAIRMCLGFALVICAISAIREVLGNKTVLGVEFSLYPLRMNGVKLPFFGFILIGFAGAFFKGVERFITHSLLRRDYKSSLINKLAEVDDNE